MMNEAGKSDRPIVPEKSPNKARPMAAEGMEGRGLAKGNRAPAKTTRSGHRAGEGAPNKLELVREKAGGGYPS